MRQMLEGKVLSWFHRAFGHWHVPACWWQPEYYSPPGCSVPGKGPNSFSCYYTCEDFSMTSIKFLRDPATGLPTDAFDAGSTTASSFAGERVGIVVNVFSIAFTVIGRWYQKMATGGRRFVCRGPSLQNEAAPSLAGQISQSSEAQVRSKTVCPVKNIGQITLWYTNSNIPLGWIKTRLFCASNQIHLCRRSLRIWMRMMRSLKKRAVLSARGGLDSGIRMHPYAGAAEKSRRYNTDVVMYQIMLLYHLCALFMSHVWLWYYVHSHIFVMCVLLAIIMNHTSCLYDTAAIISNINHTYNTCSILNEIMYCLRHHMMYHMKKKQQMNVSVLVHFKVNSLSKFFAQSSEPVCGHVHCPST